MASFELFDRNGDTGLLVIAPPGVDTIFGQDAEMAGRPDQALLDVSDITALSVLARTAEACRPLGSAGLGLSDADRQSLIRAA